MKRFYFTLAALALAAPALATPPSGNTNCNGNGSCSTTNGPTINNPQAFGGAGGSGYGFGGNAYNRTDVDVTNVNVNALTARQRQEQEQYQLQFQKQQQGNVGLGSGNVTEILIEAPDIPTKTRLANVPAVSAPNIYPTSPCMGSTSVGGSGVGFGFTLGSSWKDDDCGIRETARLFGLNTPDGIAVACQSSYAAAAPSCKKLAAQQAPAKTAAQGERTDTERKRDATVRTAGIQQPINCTADTFIAGRTGAPLCK